MTLFQVGMSTMAAVVSKRTRRQRYCRRFRAHGSMRPIRSTFSTPPARRVSRRAWCATMAATWWRWPGRWERSTTSSRAKCSGRRPMWVGSSAIPTSAYAPLLIGATTIVYEGKPVGTPDPGAFWRVMLRIQCFCLFHRADRLPRHPQGRSGRATSSSKYDLSSSCAVSTLPVSAPTRRPFNGPKRCLAFR